MENVLSSEIAQITYAQIADGLPLSSVEMDTYDYGALSGDHPLHTKHTDLCAGALEKAQQLHAEFNLSSLQVNSRASTHPLCVDIKLTWRRIASIRVSSSFARLEGFPDSAD